MDVTHFSTTNNEAQRNRLALEAAGLGVWEMHVETGMTTWNATMYALYGVSPEGPSPTFDDWLTQVHPDDQNMVMMAFTQLLASPASLNLNFRLYRSHGEIKHIRSVTRSLQSDDDDSWWLVGINEDITHQVRNRQLAAEKAQELQTFFDVSQSLMCITSLDGVFLNVNQTWQRELGYSVSELMGQPLMKLVHPEDVDASLAALGDLQQGSKVADFINRYRHCDGSYRHFEWRATPVGDRIYATANNVSMRIALETELADEKAYLQLIIDSLPSPIFVKDWQGRHTLANRSVARLFATTPGLMIGRTDADMPLPRDVHEKFLRDDREVMSQGRAMSVLEQPLIDARGDIRWYQVMKVPLLRERPLEERQVLGIATEITERKRNEQRLQRQEQLYRSLVESQQDLIVRVDSHSRFTFVNDVYCTTFGRSREELIGKTFAPMVHENDLPHTLAALQRLQQPPHPRVTIEQRAMTLAGWRWLSWEDSAILDESGQLVEIQAVGRDITELKQAQQRALSASRAKSQFLANMSHEIRTPLNAIIGFGELLAQSPLNAEQQDWTDKIKTSSHLLLSIVNDVLDYSKIEAGKLELERVPFTLKQLTTQQETLFAVAIQEKGLRLRVSHESQLQEHVALLGDPLRLGQVLTNLVGNAIKFTHRGEVTLRLRAETEDAQHCRLTCRVTDTGIGISATQRKRLFDTFTQADSSTSRRFGGTGLGLVISRRLVEQMGGMMDVSSAPGQGSCFSFSLTLPITAAPNVQATGCAPLDTRGLIGKRVMLAEDNPINQALARRLLEDLGVKVIMASNGREALERLQSARIDLVLMDLQMPEMDGFEAARRIRRQDAAIPIIALSAAVLVEERQDALAAGMNEHLAKPIESQQLSAALLRWLTGRSPPLSDPTLSDPTLSDPHGDGLMEADDAWLATLDAYGFDTQAGLESAAADLTLYRQVLCLFLDQLNGCYMPLLQALPDNTADREDIKRHLHTLKGSAAAVGATELAECAHHIETCLTRYRHARQTDIDRFTLALREAQEHVSVALGHA